MFLSSPPIPTGRQLIQFAPGAKTSAIREADESMSPTLQSIPLAVAELNPDEARCLSERDDITSVRPEFYMFDTGANDGHEWLTWGAHILADKLKGECKEETPPDDDDKWPWKASLYGESSESTWGLKAVGIEKCYLTGKGIKLCILDTGLEFAHPDFQGRFIVRKNFTRDQDNDVHGHGTHVAGTAAGPVASRLGRRYSVAPGVALHVGKVLGDNGGGREFDILSGIDWAIGQGCSIISMSLGRAVGLGEPPDPVYEAIGKAALDNGSLIIAAAGNESYRNHGYIAPVGSPANASTIMAVASITNMSRVSAFSCGGLEGNGGEVDIAGPGSSIHSAWTLPRAQKTISGTSMATPHVAGIAALYAESNKELRGRKLWQALVSNAFPLGEARDFGAGLAKAPHGA